MLHACVKASGVKCQSQRCSIASALRTTCQALIICSLLNHRRFTFSSRRPPMHLRVPMRSDPTGPEQVVFTVQSPQQPLNLWEAAAVRAWTKRVSRCVLTSQVLAMQGKHDHSDWLMPVTWCGVIPGLCNWRSEIHISGRAPSHPALLLAPRRLRVKCPPKSMRWSRDAFRPFSLTATSCSQTLPHRWPEN